jgi:hypothetical protein
MKKILLLLVVSTLLTSFQSKQDKDDSARFVGTWTLIKCITKKNDRKITYPFGENPVGQLLYDAKGNMMVQVMSPGIKNFASETRLEGTPEEMTTAYEGFLAYYGTYKVMPDSNLIIHQIKACSFPNWINKEQKRYYKFKDNKLILKTPLIGTLQSELTWQKSE